MRAAVTALAPLPVVVQPLPEATTADASSLSLPKVVLCEVLEHLGEFTLPPKVAPVCGPPLWELALAGMIIRGIQQPNSKRRLSLISGLRGENEPR
jgi:hypothetical protein